MSRRDGLKKIYLIKSADYQYAEIDVAQNTLLLGDSGVGKTTLMRAVLFFYTMDSSDSILNINRETKKSFTEWYFKYANSHIVYEYTKGESRNLFIVSSVGKLHYTFVDVTNTSLSVKELLIEEHSGVSTPVSYEKLQENIQKNALLHYVTARRDKYITAFHKRDAEGKKLKQESSVDFTLFEDIASRREFAKTLSNIFANSKVNSDALKKSIVSLIEDSQASINLKEIHKNLQEYVEHKEEIEKFEKKFPLIEKLEVTLSNYERDRKEFRAKANELHALELASCLQIEKCDAELATLAKSAQVLEDDFRLQESLVQAKIDEAKSLITLQSDKIATLEAKKEQYASEEFLLLVEEYAKLESYKRHIESLRKKYKALTQDSENITHEYREILERLEREKSEDIVRFKNEHIEQKNRLSEQKMALLESREKRLALSLEPLQKQKELLSQELEKEQRLLQQIKIEQAKVEHFTFNAEAIEKYKEEATRYERELAELRHEKLTNEVAIKEIEREIEEIASKLKSDKKLLAQEIKEQKEKLFTQKESIEQRLDYDAGNLYGYLSKNRIKNREQIITYVKDEILFSEVPFSAREAAEENSLFGLEINFHEKLPNLYEQSKLEKELRFVKNELKELSKKERVKNEALEKAASQISREKERERSRLYQSKNRLLEQEESYKKSLQRTQSSIEDAISDAKEMRETQTKELHQRYAKQELAIEKLQTALRELESEMQHLKEQIIQDSQEQVDALERSFSALEVQLQEKVAHREAQCSQDIEKTKEELHKLLERSGVDKKLLDAIELEGKELDKKVKSIESRRYEVEEYLRNFKEKIEHLPTLQEQLHLQEKALSNHHESLKQLRLEYKKELLALQSRQKEIEELKKTLQHFQKTYEEKISSQEIAKEIKHALSTSYRDDVTPLLEDSDYMSEVVPNIVTLYASVETLRSNIISETIECLKGLKSNNIFKIETISDNLAVVGVERYINIAKELVEYKTKDKIELVKDASSEIFKSSFNSIRKELNLFEDALLDVKAEVHRLYNTVRKAVDSFNVIDAIKIQEREENNEILIALKELSNFYSDNSDKFLSGLFDSLTSQSDSQKYKEELSSKISDLVKLLMNAKEYLHLESSFVLEFKVVEKGNDLGWRQTLNDIGSNGTSTLIKSIINISMLQMVSKNMFKNSQMQSHCILDEIGMISTDYFKELKEFVNSSGFLFLNGMPTEDDILISMYPTVYVGEDCGSYSRMLLASKVVEG